MRSSVIAQAEDTALDHKLLVRRCAADGVIEPHELAAIEASAEELHKHIRRSHAAQRAGESMIRYGVVVTQVARDFGDELIAIDTD